MTRVEERSTDAEIGIPLRPTDVPAGTAILVAGPAMTGKLQLVFEVLSGVDGRSAIGVTTKRSAAQIKRGLSRWGDLTRWEMRMIDCVSHQQSVGPVNETDDVRYVNSAADLTGIGMAMTEFMYEFYRTPEWQPTGIGLHSLSTMLMYADLRRVYQFAHVMTGRIKNSEFVGAFTLDTVPTDVETESRLRQVFDAVVEVRDDDGGPELRVRGGTFGPRTWTRYSPGY